MLQRIIQTMREKGVSNTELEQFLGLSCGIVSQWKNGTNKSYKKHLPLIAEYLGVSVDYLAGNTDTLTAMASANTRLIPLYNSVSAGFGACAVDLIEGYIPVYDLNAEEAKDSIAITVHGDSMSPKIEDGDVIVVHKQDSVESGTVAVILLDGDAALVKKVIYDISHIELRSLNAGYSPMVFSGANVKRIRVVGKVTEIHKKL